MLSLESERKELVNFSSAYLRNIGSIYNYNFFACCINRLYPLIVSNPSASVLRACCIKVGFLADHFDSTDFSALI